MFERIRHMVIKEFIQIFRDRRMKAIVFVIPVLQMLAFAYAVTLDVNNIPTALYDLDNSAESRELARRLEASGYFSIRHRPELPSGIQRLIDRGEALCALQIDRGFARDIHKGLPTAVQVIVDGTDSNTAVVALNYAGRVISQYAKEKRGRTDGLIDVRTRAWYNPALKSRNYNVPGVIAIVIFITCLLLTSMAVVREKEMGTMEQLMVTPLRPVELILGKTIPFAIIGFIDMFLVTSVAVFKFDIPINGPLPLLPSATAIYLLSILGTGLFISTISRTQQQALMATFLFYIPAVLLSGFMFPIENMPEIIQFATLANPLRYFLVIIRGIFLKGIGPDILWPQVAALLVIGIAVMAASSLRFKKRLS